MVGARSPFPNPKTNQSARPGLQFQGSNTSNICLRLTYSKASCDEILVSKITVACRHSMNIAQQLHSFSPGSLVYIDAKAIVGHARGLRTRICPVEKLVEAEKKRHLARGLARATASATTATLQPIDRPSAIPHLEGKVRYIGQAEACILGRSP